MRMFALADLAAATDRRDQRNPPRERRRVVSRAHHIAVIAAAAAWLTSGCQRQTAETMIESDLVRLFHAAGRTPCAGSLSYLDDSSRYFLGYLGLPLDEKIEVHLISPDRIAELCTETAVACTSPEDGTVWMSEEHLDPHELVHAIHFQNFEWSLPFINEGLASALGGTTASIASYDQPPERLLGSAPQPGVYSVGGDLSSYLLLRFGPESFLDWLSATTTDAQPGEAKASFESVFGVSMDAAIEERLASGWTFEGVSLRLDRCAADPVPWQGDRWETGATVSCEADGVGSGRLRYASFEVAEGALFEIVGGVPAFVGRCLEQDGEDVQLLRVDLATTDRLVAYLRPGRHFVHVRARMPPPDPYASVLVERTSAAGTCADPILASSEVGSTQRLVPDPGQPLAIALDAQSPEGTTVGSRIFGAGSVELCTGGCDPSECETMADDVEVPLAPGTQHFIVATSDRNATLIRIEFRS